MLQVFADVIEPGVTRGGSLEGTDLVIVCVVSAVIVAVAAFLLIRAAKRNKGDKK